MKRHDKETGQFNSLKYQKYTWIKTTLKIISVTF